jgi:hypothetical protein
MFRPAKEDALRRHFLGVEQLWSQHAGKAASCSTRTVLVLWCDARVRRKSDRMRFLGTQDLCEKQDECDENDAVSRWCPRHQQRGARRWMASCNQDGSISRGARGKRRRWRAEERLGRGEQERGALHSRWRDDGEGRWDAWRAMMGARGCDDVGRTWVRSEAAERKTAAAAELAGWPCLTQQPKRTIASSPYTGSSVC